MSRNPLLLSVLVLSAAALPAQLGPDARDQLRQIADKVAEEMKEIDRLLTSGDAGKDASAALQRSVAGIEEMLQGAQTTNKRVQQGIDELIEQLSKSGLGEGSESQSQETPQDGQQQGRERQPGPRQENPTPDMVQQPQGNQQQQGQPGERKPEGGENPLQAQNKPAAKPQNDDGKEVTERARDVSEWGNLPEYLGAIKQRGGVPEVSEKYRKLYDAYLRAQTKAGHK